MYRKLLNFFKRDIRWKLLKISKVTKLKFLYPDKFELKGIKGFYTKLIINLIVNEKISKIKKNLIKKNFNNSRQSSSKVNFLISTPASGSMFVRNMMSSYLELFYQVGDGYPKYDNINNDYFFACSPIFAGDLFNALDIKKQGFIDDEKYVSSSDFENNKIVFSRYPLTRIDLYNFKDIKPLILFRDPLEQITSRYTRSDKRDDQIKNSQINYKLLNSRIDEYEIYTKFWSEYLLNQKNGKDFLCINFIDLVSNTEEILPKILKFFNYELNEDYIKKSIFINSKENTQNMFRKLKNYNITRFTNTTIKDLQKKLIKDHLEQKIAEKKIEVYYKKLIDISKS